MAKPQMMSDSYIGSGCHFMLMELLCPRAPPSLPTLHMNVGLSTQYLLVPTCFTLCHPACSRSSWNLGSSLPCGSFPIYKLVSILRCTLLGASQHNPDSAVYVVGILLSGAPCPQGLPLETGSRGLLGPHALTANAPSEPESTALRIGFYLVNLKGVLIIKQQKSL